MKTEYPDKYELEFIFIASPKLLFFYLSTPQGLSEWFAEKVVFKDGVFHFFWEDTELKAVIDSKKENDHIRYKWLNAVYDTYFEFKIDTDSVVSENTLIITDFALKDDLKEDAMVWGAAIRKMLRIIGGKLINASA
jgi:hypothetical protein